MSDLIEAKSFVDYYWSYIKHRIPGEAAQLILNPQTNADKIQAYLFLFRQWWRQQLYRLFDCSRYAVLAFASRISGDATRASTYINQARSLAGTVFDTPEPKSSTLPIFCSFFPSSPSISLFLSSALICIFMF